MDSVIAEYPAIPDGDLMLCPEFGCAYQADMTVTVSYDAAYFGKCRSYEDKEIAVKINAGRIAIVQKHYGDGPCLDVGVGSGEFVRKRMSTWGTDVNPVAIRWLASHNLLADSLDGFGAYTFWDVIEHVPAPKEYFDAIRSGAYLFTSIPVFHDLMRVRESKHYRPGEHLYYWTDEGFIWWMDRHGFDFLERQDFEVQAGRESIYSYAFRKR